MIRVPVITNDVTIRDSISHAAESLKSQMEAVFLNTKDEVVEYLKYELPEMKIVDCRPNSGIDYQVILDDIRNDPWLHYSGMIAIHEEADSKAVQQMLKNVNVLAVLRKRDFLQNVGRLLRILVHNKQFLFQRGIQLNLMNKISGTFTIDNDPLDIIAYTNLVTNYLFNANLVSREDQEKLHVALQELLVNAIEHGNCKIGFEEKTAWLESGKHPMDLIREKNRDPEVARRKVQLAYTIAPDTSRFTITDEGDGFDWRARMDSKPEIGLHGMGMRMAGVYVQNLSYNDKGNQVSFSVQHQIEMSNVVPIIFSDQEEVCFKDREVVVREGETSDYLYYIISGRFLVFSGKKYISFLTPADMFIGEMSFLLSNQRTASVVTKGEARVVKISKHSFVELIKKNPHYGIFLARLLAQRLERLNSRAAKLNAEYVRLKTIIDGKSAGSVST